jgi:HUS1 checkpoint protein
LQSRSGKTQNLLQEIPIRILSAQQAEELKEPIVIDPRVHVLTPPVHTLRILVERMKSLSNFLLISANMNGRLKLQVENDSVKVETFFNDLSHPEIDP